MVRALLKKDLHVFRLPMITAAMLSVVPYMLSLLYRAVMPTGPYPAEPYLAFVFFAAIVSLVLAALVAAAMGGVAFAVERRDRTAEFLAMLPVSRWAIVRSKLLVAAATLTTCVGMHVLVIVGCLLWPSLREKPLPDESEIYSALGFAAVAAFTLFAVGWALSIFIDSPAIAATLSGVVGFALAFGATDWVEKLIRYFRWDELIKHHAEGLSYFIVAALSVVLGIVAIWLSSWHYVRRFKA